MLPFGNRSHPLDRFRNEALEFDSVSIPLRFIDIFSAQNQQLVCHPREAQALLDDAFQTTSDIGVRRAIPLAAALLANCVGA